MNRECAYVGQDCCRSVLSENEVQERQDTEETDQTEIVLMAHAPSFWLPLINLMYALFFMLKLCISDGEKKKGSK